MQKSNLIKLPVLFLICIIISPLTSCNQKTIVESKPFVSKPAQDIKIPYDDIEPVMPSIPKDAAIKATKSDIGNRAYGRFMTLKQAQFCNLGPKSIYVYVHSYRNRSNSPVIIENIKGVREIASKKCPSAFTYGTESMDIGFLLIPFTKVTTLNQSKSLSDFDINSNLKMILISKEKGGQWTEEQMKLLHKKYPY